MNQPASKTAETAVTRKQAIAARFDRAAHSYNQVAGVQARIAADARSLLSVEPGSRVLDIGCGTGRETVLLAKNGAQVTGLDIAADMLQKARRDYPSLTFKEGDADALPFPAQQFDAVFSSMALQWSDDPATAMPEIARVLKPGGRAQLAIMVAGSFHELVQARSVAGLPESVNTLPQSLVWEKAACQAGFQVVKSTVETYTEHFDGIRSLLHSITKAGAGLSDSGHAQHSFTRNSLKALEKAFCTAPDGTLPLTYHVLQISLER